MKTIQSNPIPNKKSSDLQAIDDRMRQLMWPYLQAKLASQNSKVTVTGVAVRRIEVAGKEITLRSGQNPKQVINDFLQDVGNLDNALNLYFQEAYEHIKKHSGVTFEEFVARASDNIANNIFSFDRPTNTANLLLPNRLGVGVGAGKTMDIKGKTAEKGAAAGLITVDQAKSKLVDQKRMSEVAAYNQENNEQIKSGLAVPVHLQYQDGRSWYYDSANEYYQMPDGQLYKSSGDPDVFDIDQDQKITKTDQIKPLMVMGDPRSNNSPYKGDIDHGLNALSKKYYQDGQRQIKPQPMIIEGENPQKYGQSTTEQLAFAAAEMADKDLSKMIRHSAENLYDASNHHIIQQDLAQGMQLMMPDGSATLIYADVDNKRVGYLDPITLQMEYLPSKNPMLDAENMLVARLNQISKDYAVFPNPRWGWQVGENGQFFIPEKRVDFKDVKQQKLNLEIGIKATESAIKQIDPKNHMQAELLAFRDNQETQLQLLQNMTDLYSSLIAFQFNQAIFDNQSQYHDAVLVGDKNVVVDANNYQQAVDELQNLNQQFQEKVQESKQKFGSNDKSSPLFTGAADQLLVDLKKFGVKKEEVLDQAEKSDDSWVNKVRNRREGSLARSINVH